MIRLKVSPGSRRSEIAGVLDMPDGARLKVRVSAPPEDGRANEAVVELLASALGVGRRVVTLESGEASREKVVKVRGLSVDEARSRLGC